MTSFLYDEEPVYCVTTDIDWASEDAIEYQQKIFDDFEVSATYFVTHLSTLTESLHHAGKIQLGVHPNFLPGSSHGSSIDEVVRTVLSLAPGVRCFRSHRYFDAAPATEALVDAGIVYDSNLMTNLQHGIRPIAHESGLVRFPCFYEDGTHNKWQREWSFARYADSFRRPGIKILSVHPLVTAFNCTSSASWTRLKGMFGQEEWTSLPLDVIRSHASNEPGPERFLVELLTDIRDRGAAVMTMEDLYTHFAPATEPEVRA